MQTRLNSCLEKVGDLIGNSAIPDHRHSSLRLQSVVRLLMLLESDLTRYRSPLCVYETYLT